MFTLAVEDIFVVKGRGIVVVGTLTDGELPSTAMIGSIWRPSQRPITAQIGGYEMGYWRRPPVVALLLRGIDREDLTPGTEVTFVPTPESIKEIRARLTLLTPDEGGRRSPIKPGYRDCLPLQAGIRGHNGVELSHRCMIALPPEERLWPGDERVLWLRVWCVPELDAVLKPGASFALTEGLVVARGTVLEVRAEPA